MIQTREYALTRAEYKGLLRHLYAKRLMIPLALLWGLAGYLMFGDLHIYTAQTLQHTLTDNLPFVTPRAERPARPTQPGAKRAEVSA